ncbi:hypothetical protein CMV_025490 [Castanea mollissima]|uniref:Uncharacterized protein n=1 Tax=Castanea mollissima TaxID=60419 RepID=A0A8J4QFT3_9ROSI|nr:hypothetical protein CMV_025490 [Castanea mollissima]
MYHGTSWENAMSKPCFCTSVIHGNRFCPQKPSFSTLISLVWYAFTFACLRRVFPLSWYRRTYLEELQLFYHEEHMHYLSQEQHSSSDDSPILM